MFTLLKVNAAFWQNLQVNYYKQNTAIMKTRTIKLITLILLYQVPYYNFMSPCPGGKKHYEYK